MHDRGGNVIAEVDASGNTAREYIWLPEAGYAGTDLPIAVVDGVATAAPSLAYVHTDNISRPIRMTDAAKVAGNEDVRRVTLVLLRCYPRACR